MTLPLAFLVLLVTALALVPPFQLLRAALIVVQAQLALLLRDGQTPAETVVERMTQQVRAVYGGAGAVDLNQAPPRWGCPAYRANSCLTRA